MCCHVLRACSALDGVKPNGLNICLGGGEGSVLSQVCHSGDKKELAFLQKSFLFPHGPALEIQTGWAAGFPWPLQRLNKFLTEKLDDKPSDHRFANGRNG